MSDVTQNVEPFPLPTAKPSVTLDSLLGALVHEQVTSTLHGESFVNERQVERMISNAIDEADSVNSHTLERELDDRFENFEVEARQVSGLESEIGDYVGKAEIEVEQINDLGDTIQAAIDANFDRIVEEVLKRLVERLQSNT